MFIYQKHVVDKRFHGEGILDEWRSESTTCASHIQTLPNAARYLSILVSVKTLKITTKKPGVCRPGVLKPWLFLRIRTKADTPFKAQTWKKNETQFKGKTKTENLMGTPKSSQDFFPNTLL